MNEQKQTSILDQSFIVEDAIKFNHGLPGFESLTHFIIANVEGHPPFRILKSVEEPEISMLILDIKLIKTSAKLKIPKEDLKKIKVNGASDSKVEIYAILKFDRESRSFTANIKAPLVINSVDQIGQQVILDNEELSLNHPLTPV